MQQAIKREAVSSGNVASVGHDSATNTLEVEFKGGTIYRYDNVPASVYESLRGAASVGGYLAANIKNNPNYSYRRVN